MDFIKFIKKSLMLLNMKFIRGIEKLRCGTKTMLKRFRNKISNK